MDDDPSPEEIRRRRLAYFELTNGSVAQSTSIEREKSSLETATDKNWLSNNVRGAYRENQQILNEDEGSIPSKNPSSDPSFQSNIKDKPTPSSDSCLKDVKDKPDSRYGKERWLIETGPTKLEGSFSGEGAEREKMDSFSLLREELRTKAQCGDEEGYNSAVERLISLAKQEIADSENQKNAGQGSSKARYVEHSPRYLHHGDSTLHKNSTPPTAQVSPKIDYVSSKKDFVSPIAVEYEDFFSKSVKHGKYGSGPEVRESTDEPDARHLFQKSLGNVDELGLSTHRPESTQAGNSSTSIDSFIHGDIRQALGEEKYKEFIEKSAKDIDHLNSDRSSSHEEKQQKPTKPKLPEKPKGLNSEHGLKPKIPEKPTGLSSEPGLKLNISKDASAEKNMDKEKPKLNRPKFVPSNIYSQDNEEEAENLSLPPSYRHGYESLHRNVVFSSDEIYHQAYLGQSPPVSRSYMGNPAQFSREFSQGQPNPAPRVSTMMTGSAPYPMPPFPPHVQQHAVRMPYPPPDDLMYTARSQQSEAYRHMYSGVTPRPYPESRPVDIRPEVMDPSMYKPWPSEPPPQPYYEGFAANGIPKSPDMRYMSPHISHPLEGHHFSPAVSRMSESYYATAPLSQSPDGRFMPFQVPRPPDVPNVHSSGDVGKHFQRRPDLGYHGREGAMISPPQAPANMRPEGEGGVYPPYPPQRHAGIPYPPPPVNVDLGSYFNFLAAQGFPVPYPVPYPVQSGQTPPQVDTQNKDATQDRENDDKEMLEMMIPHPPLQKKDSSEKIIHRKSSPRKTVPPEEAPKSERGSEKERGPKKTEGQKPEGKSVSQKQQSKNASQRHVDEIRQFHEQRRQQEADEDALLEKQRKFAKSSIDRYFSSLEKLYYRDRQDRDPEEEEMEEILENSPQEQDSEVNTEVNTQVSKVTSVKAEGITERMNKLGLDLSFLREAGKSQEGVPKEEGKTVLVCEECGEVNKVYMSWCGDCGESLAGIEVTIIKKPKPPRVSKKDRSPSKFPQNKAPPGKSPPNKSPPVASDSSSTQSSQKDRVRAVKESRDSGHPSSEEIENAQAGREIEEIFEHVTDPVIKGFISSYYRKKQAELMQNEEDADDEEENFFTKGKESLNGFAEVEMQHNEEDNTQASQNQPRVDSNQYEIEISKFIDNEEVWLHERKKPKEKPLKHKRSAPIDVEVFSVKESKQQKDTSRSQEKIVPSLNLYNSSDEEKPRVSLDISTDSEDWQDFFIPKPVEVEKEVTPEPEEPEDVRPFLEQVMGDMRSSLPTKSKSKNARPKTGGKSVKSVVRESIEAPGYERKWQRSSIAWSSYHPRELSKKTSLPPQRPGSAGPSRRGGRGRNSGSVENLVSSRPRSGGVQKKPAVKSRPQSADPKVRSGSGRPVPQEIPVMEVPIEVGSEGEEERPLSGGRTEEEDRTQSGSSKEGRGIPGIKVLDVTYPPPPKASQDSPSSDLPGLVNHRLLDTKDTAPPAADPASVLHAYNKYHEMTPRIRDGNFSVWLCLPDELLLNILSYLPHSDLVSCARTCHHFYRVCMDNTLWRYITIKKNHSLTDESLERVGKHHPVSLALIQCHGDYITAKGLRNLFRACANSLKELNFFGCSRGALTGDCILLHAASHCKELTHIDASWCNVSDSGIGAIANSANRLESLCINGCQMITNEGLITVIKKHGKWLRVLEMFGCFNIKAKAVSYLSANCINLKTLNLGQCYKLTDSLISQLSPSLSKVETLDLRGCKQIKDNCIRYVVKYCNRLQTLTLANCPNITDISLLEIATYLKDIRNLDVCGCRNVTDGGVRALANNCSNLRSIDISSTGCTHRSVLMMANFCSQRLDSVKLNFLSDVTEHAVIKLVKHCRRLKLLHLYGCTSIRSLANIRDANPHVKVEM